ncbi:RNA polymerase sigma factor [Amycolatopsis magusensis]|uniref:RNA polymerase sigma factor n=1 Tax=Amycolatopsis magusensis TaxID=882444 RepID=UPI0024A7FD61|nr:RNA polymerase sigma factor [Amycolatopsis magusensis]MDI5976790.1 RNA polymerase sigma factor [Amycolatopsis magusensis]
MRTATNTSPAPRPDSSDPPTDAALLAGTRTDFATVFDRHAAEIYRYCARRIGTDAVDDAVADTFTIAYERRARFDATRSSALPWLYGIATNVLRRYRAAEARHRKLVQHESEASAEPTAERAVSRADADTAIRALAGELDKVPRRQRDVLYLYAAGLSYADIATALEIPIGTVMSRLHRARTRLRAALLAQGITGTTLEGSA